MRLFRNKDTLRLSRLKNIDNGIFSLQEEFTGVTERTTWNVLNRHWEEVAEVTAFNLSRILKDAPNGYMLDSPVFGIVALLNVCPKEISFSYTKSNGNTYRDTVDNFGRENDLLNCRCIIFPQGKDTWFGFKPDWNTKPDLKIFHAGQKVLVPFFVGNARRWKLDFYSHFSNEVNRHILVGGASVVDKYIYPYKGNEDMLDKEVND